MTCACFLDFFVISLCSWESGSILLQVDICNVWFDLILVIICMQVKVTADRDPDRLLRPTEGWKERQKSAGPSGSGPLLRMPHRYWWLDYLFI